MSKQSQQSDEADYAKVDEADKVNKATDATKANEANKPMIQQVRQVNEADDTMDNKVNEADDPRIHQSWWVGKVIKPRWSQQADEAIDWNGEAANANGDELKSCDKADEPIECVITHFCCRSVRILDNQLDELEKWCDQWSQQDCWGWGDQCDWCNHCGQRSCFGQQSHYG